MDDLKQSFKKQKKNYHEIAKYLNELYNKNEQNLNDIKEISNKVLFFVENIKDMKILRDLFTKKEISKKEIEESKNNDENDEIILTPDEIEELKKAFNTINNFAKEVNNYITKKNKYKNVFFESFKQLLEGFINPNTFKENKFIPKKKEVIDDKQRAQIQYNNICQLLEKDKDMIHYEILFGKLSNIKLENLEKEQLDNLIEISINIYYHLTDKQKEKISEKFSELIDDEEIWYILFIEYKNIFSKVDKRLYNEKNIYESILENLAYPLEVHPKRKEKYNENKINRNNAYNILLPIYKELLMYKNKENSYINLNKNNIIEKVYYYLIANFLTYDDKLRDGNIFYQFLYVKYLCEEKYDYKKLIENKENIQKEIIIYSKEDLKNKEELEEKLKKDDLEEFDNDEDDNSLPNISLINNLKKIIPEEYIKLYFEVKQNISNFYIIPFPINILVNKNNINFTFNIIDMILFFRKYTNKIDWINIYKNNLIKIEKDIFDYYIKSTSEYINIENKKENDKEKNNRLIGYRVNEKMKKAYDSLIKYLNDKLPKDKYYEIQFIPFGSVTQFLSGENGDIDLFMNIESSKQNPLYFKAFHQTILNKLMGILKQLDKNLVFHQTNRLCLYTFEYQGIKIDINVYGICSYYGELLLREYSLMDFRFPMLVIYIKHIISNYHIKNTEEDKSYINSFAWTNILLTFLQDILDPPLFPKLLNEKNKNKIAIKVGGGAGINQKKKLENEIEFQKIRSFDVAALDDNNNIKNIEQIKEQFYGKEEYINDNDIKIKSSMKFTRKNDMSVSEILLKFVQFIGYFFNYKYTMVNASYENQGFVPKIEKIKSKDEFVKCVFKKCDDPENVLLTL